MSELNSARVSKEELLGVFHTRTKVEAKALQQSGEHLDVLQGVYNEFSREIKNLVGWKKLREFKWLSNGNNTPDWAKSLDRLWNKQLNELGIANEMAVKDDISAEFLGYRLFVLRDGSLLLDLNGRKTPVAEYRPLVHGDIIDIHEALGVTRRHRKTNKPIFVELIEACRYILSDSISARKELIRKQEDLRHCIDTLLSRVRLF